jgi:hypothetical protein
LRFCAKTKVVAEAKGLTTHCDKKEKNKSGDQNPLKKTGRILKSLMSRKKMKIMKSKLTTFVAVLFLSIWTLSSNAQTTIPKSKAQLIEFTNSTAKFTVPSGKTWTVHSVFTSFPADNNYYYIYVKSINSVILTDISKNMFGLLLYCSNTISNYPPSLILPENTSIEFIITKKVEGIRSLYDKSAFLNFSETEN